MKKLICLLVFAAVSLSVASAQDYNWGVGVRIGGEMGGASVKYKFNTANALEGIMAAPWKNGFLFTVLYERYIPVIDKGFHFYYGAGAHLGDWQKKFTFGVDGIIGLEYKFKEVPLALSLDYKPVLNFIGKKTFKMADIALGIRVTF